MVRNRSIFSIAAILTFGCLTAFVYNYHIVRASDGHHVVAKTENDFQDVYVDLRRWTVGDVAEHPDVASAVAVDKLHEVESAMEGSLDDLKEIFEGTSRKLRDADL